MTEKSFRTTMLPSDRRGCRRLHVHDFEELLPCRFRRVFHAGELQRDRRRREVRVRGERLFESFRYLRLVYGDLIGLLGGVGIRQPHRDVSDIRFSAGLERIRSSVARNRVERPPERREPRQGRLHPFARDDDGLCLDLADRWRVVGRDGCDLDLFCELHIAHRPDLHVLRRGLVVRRNLNNARSKPDRVLVLNFSLEFCHAYTSRYVTMTSTGIQWIPVVSSWSSCCPAYRTSSIRAPSRTPR